MKTHSYRKTVHHRSGVAAGIRPGHRWAWLMLALGFAGLAQKSRAGTHIWSGGGGAGNTNWSHAANWTSGVVPVAGESNIVLIFPSSAGRESTVNIAGLSVSRIEVENLAGSPYHFRSAGVSVTLNGAAGENFLVTGAGSGTVRWEPNLVLTGTNWFNNSSTLGSALILDCAISGTGNFTKRGAKDITFRGATANTYTGTTRVSDGTLWIDKSPFTTGFAGSLVVEGGECYTSNSNVIPDNVSISVTAGEFALGSAVPTTETLGVISLSGTGRIDVGIGTIVLSSSVNVAAAADASIVASSGELSLGGGTHIFNVETGGLLTVACKVMDGGGAGSIIKNSPGALRLTSSSNTFSGTCTVNAGVLQASASNALGSTAGATVVQAGATLELGTGNQAGSLITLPAGETIQLAGTMRAVRNSQVNGSVVLSGAPLLSAAAGAELTFGGVLSGAASPLTITGPGPVQLAGTSANTYSGSTEIGITADLRLKKTTGNALPGSVKYVNSGSIKLLAANQIADNAAVWMFAGGTFDLNAFHETLGSVYGSGLVSPIVKLGTATLTMNVTSDVQLGSASAPASIEGPTSARLKKEGAGTFTLYQNRLDAGTAFPVLEVQVGTVNLFDEWLGPIHVEGGQLRGRATTGVITADGGSVCLCDFSAAGFFGTTAGFVRADLGGNTAGTSYDRMVVNGAVDLRNLTLVGNLFFLPYTGSQFTIIQNNGPDPVTGTFVGLPEGATVLLQGEAFTISYCGGASGRDVVLSYQGQGLPLPEITGLEKQANGNVIVRIKGPGNTGFKLYHSTTLQAGSWTLLGTVTTSAAGTADYTHAVPAAPRRFYRLALE